MPLKETRTSTQQTSGGSLAKEVLPRRKSAGLRREESRSWSKRAHAFDILLGLAKSEAGVGSFSSSSLGVTLSKVAFR